MRHWLFHPLLFYPLAALIAGAVILLSLRPQSFPREPAAVSGRIEGGALVLDGAAFNAPEHPAGQHVVVSRDDFGHPLSLRIATLPGVGAPAPGEANVLIRLDPVAASFISGRRLDAEIAYRPLVVTAASALALSVQGNEATQWVTQPIPPLSNAVRFTIPPARGVAGIGLRTVSPSQDYAYGVEIVSIRLTPLADAPVAAPPTQALPPD